MNFKIPLECERTKNISVSQDFIQSLKKAMNWGKAEKLPVDSYYPLYVNNRLLDEMNVADNQIIWGRRGTGKTHLLKAFTQMINENPNEYKLSYYISCDNIKMETPVDLIFNNDYERMKYFARQTYKAFLINIIEQIINNYQDLLEKKYRFNESNIENKKKFYDNIDNCLTNLLENSTIGLPHIVETFSKRNINKNRKRKRENGYGFNGEISMPKVLSSIKGCFKFNKIKTNNDENVESNETEQKIKYSFSFHEIQREISKLIEAIGIDMIYICIDELWLIDDKNNISFQPMFLDYLRQTFFGQSGISIKIASIRETTKLNNKTSAGNNYGLQSGHDIFELENLDYLYKKDNIIFEKFAEIITMRICFFSDLNIEYNKQYVIETIFKNSRYFNILVSMANGIPRNFLRILQLCLGRINYNLEKYFIHVYLISDTVMDIFVNERRSNLALNENSVYNIISKYLENSKNVFFIISNDQIKKFSMDINNLIYTEILHRIPSSATPISIMDSYKAFFVDAGKYLYLLKEKNIEEYKNVVINFELVIPDDLKRNKEKYIVNLETASAEHIECKNCGAIINRNDPVFVKYHSCSKCAYKFEG